MSQRKGVFKVSINLPEGVNLQDMREYIEEAVGSWRGQCHFDDPWFKINRDNSLRVVRYKKPPKKKCPICKDNPFVEINHRMANY
jgi:hypothetical protein